MNKNLYSYLQPVKLLGCGSAYRIFPIHTFVEHSTGSDNNFLTIKAENKIGIPATMYNGDKEQRKVAGARSQYKQIIIIILLYINFFYN